MARPRRERSLGEMISTVCFYFVGAYFVLEGFAFYAKGSEAFRYWYVAGWSGLPVWWSTLPNR